MISSSSSSQPTAQELIDNLDVTGFYSAYIPGFNVNGDVSRRGRLERVINAGGHELVYANYDYVANAQSVEGSFRVVEV